MVDPLELREYRGDQIADCLDTLADLRMTVFREWPYLYEGDIDYERRYLDVYVQSPRSFALVVHDGDRPVGATTALPMADEDAALQRPFVDTGFDPDLIFYNGESILLPEYRGRGLYRKFFDAREAHARSFGGFRWMTFCGVRRPAHHPSRPPDYIPLDATWRRYGYEARPDLVAYLPWRDVGDEEETEKPLQFWLKRLT